MNSLTKSCRLALALAPLLLLPFARTASAAPANVDEAAVYTAGSEGYKSFRIPSLIVTKKGTLLAFCEGRKTSGRDSGDINVVMRRSVDGGQTWGAMRVIWDDAKNTCGNPCAVIDEETGDIILLMTHNRGDDVEKQIRAGESKESRTVWITRSTDDGLTWSDAREITSSVKPAGWRWYATGPGIGIQLHAGAHKGRLVIPCDHSEADGSGWSHVVYSDDHGATWHLGGKSPSPHTDECQVAELSDGRLMLNMRAGSTKEPSRGVCISKDGGETWSDYHHDPVLIESRCQGSILALRANDKPALLFSNPADKGEKSRTHFTVRMSYDDGATWPLSLVLNPGFGAYSCLASLSDGRIACLYERGVAKGYETITLARFPLNALTQTGTARNAGVDPSGTLVIR